MRRRRRTWRRSASCSPRRSSRWSSWAAAAGTAKACADIKAFVEANDLPVCDLVPQPGPDRQPPSATTSAISASASNPPLGKRIDEPATSSSPIGPRLGEATTGGYTLFDLPVPKQKLVHVHAGAEELGRVYQATLPINSGMAQFAAAAKAMKPVDASAWKAGVRGGARRLPEEHRADAAAGLRRTWRRSSAG